MLNAKRILLVLGLVAFLGLEAQAYYNATTGRWLNRDPVGERGGINLSAFLRNEPCSKIDRLGLACATCSPDVTRQVKRALLRMEMTFWGWEEPKKRAACERLVDWFNGPRAWELEPLYTWVTADVKVGFLHSLRPSCYYASAVNYSLWGAANRVCNEAAALYSWQDRRSAWSLRRALWWARFWKEKLLNDYTDRAYQAYAFTTYGYAGFLPHFGIIGETWDGRTYRGEIDWYWEPYKPKSKN